MLTFQSYMSGTVSRVGPKEVSFLMPSFVSFGKDGNAELSLRDENAERAAQALIDGAKRLGIRVNVQPIIDMPQALFGNIHCLTQRLD